MVTRFLLPVAVLASFLGAQNIAIYPSDYVNVSEGPYNSPRVPLARGTSRIQVVYESWDLTIPIGSQITSLGFREDATLTTMDQGQTLQLEIWMGYTANHAGNLSTTLDNNWAGTHTTVFGPAQFTLPNLRDAAAPLPNGMVWVPLTTPFTYDPGTDNLLIEYRCYGNSVGGSSFNYRLDRADFYSETNNGPAGCPHGSGTPQLDLAPTRVNSSFSAYATRAPQNGFLILLFDAGGRLATPYSLQPLLPGIAPTCMGQINMQLPLLLTGIANSGGSLTWSFRIPNDWQTYNDFWITCQYAAMDFFAPGGVVVSNGAEVQIGMQPRCGWIVGGGSPQLVTTGTRTINYCPVAFFEYQ